MNIIQQTTEALLHCDEDQIAHTLEMLREAPYIFCIGNGGGYAHASHFASDLRKIAGKQAFAPDNTAELTARINDQGWEASLRDWIYSFKLDRMYSLVFVFSVGGGAPGTSANLMGAYDRGPLTGICGLGPGRLQWEGEPIVIPSTSTPVIEGAQSVIAHYLVDALC